MAEEEDQVARPPFQLMRGGNLVSRREHWKTAPIKKGEVLTWDPPNFMETLGNQLGRIRE